MSDQFTPRPEDKFSFGLWTVGNRGRDPFGDAVRDPLPPEDAVTLLADVGAWGVNLHDNDLVPIDAAPGERDRIVSSFARACERVQIVVPMATVNLFFDPVFRDGAFTSNDDRVRAYAVQKTMRAMPQTKIAFIRQQGFLVSHLDTNLYTALMLQPKIVGAIAVVGAGFQSAVVFFLLSGLLLWSTALPSYSVFNGIYNVVVARRRGFSTLEGIPPPRRFAQGLAGVIALAIGAALLANATFLAYGLELLLLDGVISVLAARFCLGSYLHHLIAAEARTGSSDGVGSVIAVSPVSSARSRSFSRK